MKLSFKKNTKQKKEKKIRKTFSLIFPIYFNNSSLIFSPKQFEFFESKPYYKQNPSINSNFLVQRSQNIFIFELFNYKYKTNKIITN